MPLSASIRPPQAGTSPADSLRRWTKHAWQGVVEIGHNSLAVLGLACIGVVLFFSGDSALRHQIERQALEWLHLRHGVLTSGGSEADTVDLLADLNEPEAVARSTARPLSALPRQQALVANWIARRYRVAPEPVAHLVQEAWLLGKKANLDPTLILAIMAIESSFNPFAQSPVGAQGLMQVMTSVHDDKYASFGGRLAAFDPVTNVRVGVQVLIECISRAGGSLEAGLKYYVGAANLPDDGGYAERVLTEQSYLRQVAEGQNVAVTAPSLRTTVAAAPTGMPMVPAATTSTPSPTPTSMLSAAAAAVSKAIPFVGNGHTVMAPALGAPVAINMSAPAGNAPAMSAPAGLSHPVADKSTSAAAAPVQTAPAAAVPAAATAAPASPAAVAPAAPAPVTTSQALPSGSPAATLNKPAAPSPAASGPADAEPRPAKPKTETASIAAATTEARVALASGAAR